MMRILSWSSGLGCDKAQSPDYNLLVNEKQAPPLSSMQLPSYLKRKRSPSVTMPTQDQTSGEQRTVSQQTTPESWDQFSSKQSKPLTPEASPDSTSPAVMNVNPQSQVHENMVSDDLKADKRRQKMRQTISSQLSLEILLKHRELRLIDQELAKCQIALEQLRRCSEIPYPGTRQPSEQVTNGRGPVVRRPSERFPAQSPAPWGVTDGPYTRHYAKWLLPDPRFDGGEPEPATPHTANGQPVNPYARSTRGSFTDFAQLAGKTPRSQRGSNHMALPPGYGEPKQKPTGPMVVKRKSDGKMVKLVCPDCGRHDFGSAQGFINHCRIGHQRNFASHDAAAEACGEAVEYDANGAVKGVEVESTPSGSNVHPLVRSARLLSASVLAATPPKGAYLPKSERKEQSKTESPVSPNYEGCGQTPHLSKFVKGKGIGLNLHELVTDAKTKVELPESDGEEDEMEVDSPVALQVGRHPQVAGSKQPLKSVGPSTLGRGIHPRKHLGANSRTVGGDSAMTSAVDVTDFAHDNLMPLLPSPTNESHQAPSLIDDDEEMDPQSPPSSDELDENDVHFHVRDDEQLEDGPELRGSDLQSPPGTCAPTPAPRSRAHSRTASAIRQNPSVKDDKHVSFQGDETVDEVEGNERKRRKTDGK